MKRFEYKSISFDTKGFLGGKVNLPELDAALNEMGEAGWELVEVISSNQETGKTRNIVAVFKRESV